MYCYSTTATAAATPTPTLLAARLFRDDLRSSSSWSRSWCRAGCGRWSRAGLREVRRHAGREHGAGRRREGSSGRPEAVGWLWSPGAGTHHRLLDWHSPRRRGAIQSDHVNRTPLLRGPGTAREDGHRRPAFSLWGGRGAAVRGGGRRALFLRPGRRRHGGPPLFQVRTIPPRRWWSRWNSAVLLPQAHPPLLPNGTSRGQGRTSRD